MGVFSHQATYLRLQVPHNLFPNAPYNLTRQLKKICLLAGVIRVVNAKLLCGWGHASRLPGNI